MREVAEFFTAVGTCALAIITFWLVKAQIVEQKTSTGLSLFVQLTQEFQSPQMRSLRRVFAADLYQSRKDPGTFSGLSDESVLEFFEQLAFFTNRGVLDKSVVSNYFSYALECYWSAARTVVGDVRNSLGDDTLYRGVQELAEEFLRTENGHPRREGSTEIPSKTIDSYLVSEMNLSG